MFITQCQIEPERLIENNLIIAKRCHYGRELDEKIAAHVRNFNNEPTAVFDEIYAFRKIEKGKWSTWSRVTVRHFKGNVPVLRRLDGRGIFDFDNRSHEIRKIKDPFLLFKADEQFKMFVYGLLIDSNKKSDFQYLFNQLIRGQKTQAIIGLVKKESAHMAFAWAGDIFYECNGKILSFRQVLIRNKVGYPREVTASLNQRLFAKCVMLMNGRNIWESEWSSTMSEAPNINAIKTSQQQLIDKLKILEASSESRSTIKAIPTDHQLKEGDNLILEASSESRPTIKAIPTGQKLEEGENLILEASSESRSTIKAIPTGHQLKEGDNLILEDQNSTIWVIENRFELFIAKVAGEGSFGAVFKSVDRQTNTSVAAKVSRSLLFGTAITPAQLAKERSDMMREGQMVRRFDHVNVIKLLHLLDDRYHVTLIFPLMMKSLDDVIEDDGYQFNEKETKGFVAMILAGIEHIHSLQIVHRDLKPGNILIDENGCIKIADFGLSTMVGIRPLTSNCGTKHYKAPEILIGCGYSKPVDIWAIGCIFAELVSGEPLVRSVYEQPLDNIFHVFGLPTNESWSVCNWRKKFYAHPGMPLMDKFGKHFELLQRLTVFNPAMRATATEALKSFKILEV